MKKNIPYLIIIIICIVTTLITTISACSAKRAADQLLDGTNESKASTVTETLIIPPHEAATEVTEITSHIETTVATEEQTTEEHEVVTEVVPVVTTTPPPPPETEPAPEEMITELITEPEIIEPVISLEFLSMGNGTCSVIGIGNVTDTYIVIPEQSPNGEAVTAIEEKAFFGNQTIRAVEIPSTVSIIGDLAFADCPELVYIAVDKSNRLFTDVGGVLYSIEMTKLICYPSANGASSVNIPSSVSKISAMAFYGTKNLKTVYFEGTLEDWSKLNIGEMNYGLYTASIICSDMEN